MASHWHLRSRAIVFCLLLVLVGQLKAVACAFSHRLLLLRRCQAQAVLLSEPNRSRALRGFKTTSARMVKPDASKRHDALQGRLGKIFRFSHGYHGLALPEPKRGKLGWSTLSIQVVKCAWANRHPAGRRRRWRGSAAAAKGARAGTPPPPAPCTARLPSPRVSTPLLPIQAHRA